MSEVRDLHEVEAAVRGAWGAVLPDAPAEGGETWEETGADSLKTLLLVLELERRLGRKIPFDLIDPEASAAALALRIFTQEPQGAVSPRPERPLVFLVPGVFGDEPSLADFRRWFGDRVRFEILELPGPSAPARILRETSLMGEEIARIIVARAPSGPILLAGYSMGGAAAFEAAAHLARWGRNVSRLIVVDSYLPGPADTTRTMPRSLKGGAADLLAFEWDRARRLLDRIFGLFPPRAAGRMRRWLIRRFRREALVSWRPAPPQAPLLLAISDESAPEILPRWRRLAPGAELVRLAGRHDEVFTREALETLGPAVLTTLPQTPPIGEAPAPAA